jgi:excisionase family DNA binding protein
MNGKKERTSDRDGETAAGSWLNLRDLVYTPKEAAVVLKVHVNTIYELCRRNELPHCYVGHQIRIAAAALDVFVQRTPAPPPPPSAGSKFRRE